jgi:hypothetical protein
VRKRIVPFLIQNPSETMKQLQLQSQGGPRFSLLQETELQRHLRDCKELSPDMRIALTGEKIYLQNDDKYVGTVVAIANCELMQK